MSEELNEYEMFRLKRLQNSYEEDNMSAHFSNKESFPDFSDRPQTNSARSSPEQLVDQLQLQMAVQRKQYSELQNKYSSLTEQQTKLQQTIALLQEQLKNSQNQNQRLTKQLASRVERDKGTKGKLKQWVNVAKQNLKQF